MRIAAAALLLLPFVFFSCGKSNPGGDSPVQPLSDFSLSSPDVEAGPSGGTERVEVNAACEWSVRADAVPAWLEIATDDTGISLSFSENLGKEDRTASFDVVPADPRLEPLNVGVLQNGLPAGLDRNGIICALAWSLLSDTAKARLSLLYPGGLASVAPALDIYLAIDKYNAYVPGLRKMSMNKGFFYDPNPTQAHGGDCLRGLRFAHYYLSHLERFNLPDEEFYFYHSLLVAMVEDIHNLSLPALMPAASRWVDADGADAMDAACEELFGQLSFGGILRNLGVLSDEEAGAIAEKPFEQWAQETCATVAGVPADTASAVRTAIRNAGYRLAALFNSYYGTLQ